MEEAKIARVTAISFGPLALVMLGLTVLVIPALKTGNFAKARKSFAAFDTTWDSVEDMIKNRSKDDYVAIEKGMIDIEKALMPENPDVGQVTALVNGVMGKYNVTVTEMLKEARSRQ
jgi:hypothetical protein